MSQKWSGLAPAVDAHLARWALANQYRAAIDHMMGADLSKTEAVSDLLRSIRDSQWLGQWCRFGMSYGLPDATGKPQIVMGVQADQGVVDALDAMVQIQPIEGAASNIDARPSVVFDRVVEGTTIMGLEQFIGDAAGMMQGVHLAYRELVMLANATSHYVSAEVIEEVTMAARLAEDDVLHEDDLFCPVGFAVFEKPVSFTDLDPESGEPDPDLHVWVRAMGWHVHGGIASMKDHTINRGVTIFLYTTREDYAEGYYADLKRSGREPAFDPYEVPDGLIPVEVSPWSFNVTWTSRSEVGYVPGTVPEPIAEERRWFMCFMRLCWQQIVIRHRDFDRPERRRIERVFDKRRRPLNDYTVLRLRRIIDPVRHDETGFGKPLDHRVLVRGHWSYIHLKAPGGPTYLTEAEMLERYGEIPVKGGLKNPENHRWVWIEEYWKGPDDGPIGAMHHGTSVIR